MAFMSLAFSNPKLVLVVVVFDNKLEGTGGTKAFDDGTNVAHDAAVASSKANAAERD